MAYRRKQGGPPPPEESFPAPSLAAKAIRASSAYRDSSFSSAYANLSPSPRNPQFTVRPSPHLPKGSTNQEYTPMKKLETKQGFWGVLARKAKAIIDDGNDNAAHVESPGKMRLQMSDTATMGQYNYSYASPEIHQKTDSPKLKKGLDSFTSSLSNIGGTIGNALEEGLNIVENRTVDFIQETRKLQIRKKTGGLEKQNQTFNNDAIRQQTPMQAHVQPQIHTDLETQLKASRDVAMAMAAKAKLLLRELKTIKADLAFAKERCAQLEEENKILRESHETGDNPEDDDLIRLQLETLLAEKARLTQENSVFARENRFLREIVEYHQLTMQDVVYLDEGSEEVTEVYPIKVPTTPEVSSNVNPLGSFIHMPEK